MGDENPRLIVQVLSDALLIEMLGDMGIHRAQWIVQQVKIRLSVNCSGKIDPGPLATG